MFFSAVSIIHISCVVPSVLRIIPLWAPGLFLELLTGRGLGGREKVGGGKKKKEFDNTESKVPTAHNKLLYSMSYTNWT